jgi:murein L,D-transpeptidase YafK
MTTAIAQPLRRRPLIAYAALGVLAGVSLGALLTPAQALPLDNKDIAVDRAERKRIASSGKPLPGTPELGNLDERLARRGFRDDSSMFIRIFKAESELEVWMSRGGGAGYALFASYPICNWSGTLGPKLREGDRQAPEGFYTVTLPQANPNGRRWPKALDIGYPNPFDTLHARSGSYILIHGGCASIGCFAMTNGVHKELHELAVRVLDAGQPYVPIHVFPFRMTDENLTRYATPSLMPFWRNLKEGYDLFEHSRRPPRVSVCGARYRFEETGALDGANPGPIEVCPETAALLESMREINTRVAVQSASLPVAAKPALAYFPSYGGELAHAALTRPVELTRRGENSLAQLAPQMISAAGVSAVLTGALPCSLALPSCRKYAALRGRIVHDATLKAQKQKAARIAYTKKKKKKKKHHKRKHHHHH